MPKYVISVYSNYTGDIDSEIVSANNIRDAFINCSWTKDWIQDMPDPTIKESTMLEDLKQYMWDNDHALNIIRID